MIRFSTSLFPVNPLLFINYGIVKMQKCGAWSDIVNKEALRLLNELT